MTASTPGSAYSTIQAACRAGSGGDAHQDREVVRVTFDAAGRLVGYLTPENLSELLMLRSSREK